MGLPAKELHFIASIVLTQPPRRALVCATAVPVQPFLLRPKTPNPWS